MLKNRKKGFTLLELLVVVLIIGILAGIALPQYRKAVEKAKLAEALTNFKVLEDGIERYILANGFPNRETYLPDIPLDVELTGGEFNDFGYVTDNFYYEIHLLPEGDLTVYVYRSDDKYQLCKSEGRHICGTMFTNIGKYICKYLEPQGWEYLEGEW